MTQLTCLRRLGSVGLLIALGGLAGAQTTWHVDVHGVPPGAGTPAQPYTSIQYAIVQASTVSGDTLLVAPGDYVENVDTLGKSLELRASGGALLTTIRPAQAGNVVLLQGADTQLVGFTVTGNSSPSGVAAVHVKGGSAHIRRSIVRDNAGCGILGGANTYVYSSTVTGNTVGAQSPSLGGFVYLESSIVHLNGFDIVEDAGSAGVFLSFCLVGDADPGFWNYEVRDLRLRPGAAAIDAGNPMSMQDPDGSVVDAGALTYDPLYAPGPSAYCTGKLNSQGCVPAIGAIGTASATLPEPFTITATNEPSHKSGLLFFGFGDRAQPFQGGLHCVELPLTRVGVQNSGGSGPCTGTYAFDMRSTIQSGIHPALVPGALVYCQWWNRDPLEPQGFGTGLSDALYFGIAP